MSIIPFRGTGSQGPLSGNAGFQIDKLKRLLQIGRNSLAGLAIILLVGLIYVYGRGVQVLRGLDPYAADATATRIPVPHGVSVEDLMAQSPCRITLYQDA